MFRLGSHSSHSHRGLVRAASATAVVTLCATVLVAGPVAVAPAVAASGVRLDAVGNGLRSAEVPLGGMDARTSSRTTAVATPRTVETDGFTMVGATWSGSRSPDLDVRVRGASGWGRWQQLRPLGDGPDHGSREARKTSVGGASDLLWVGRHDELQVRSAGPVPADAELVLTDTSAVRVPGTPPAHARQAPGRTARTTTTRTTARGAKPDRAPRPRIRSRKTWGANEKWRDGDPVFGKNIKQVHVHHTVNSNSYDRDDVPGILQGIYRYHTKSLGWSDIGYNVLVDRFGRAWVGRYGGVAKRVQGAHTLGFNHNSTGVAVIGNFETVEPRKAVRRTIAEIAAWLLDREGRRATGTVVRISHGSDKFREGRRVRLPVIDGHRDTNDTACPGQELYDVLHKIRWGAQKRINRF